MNIFVKVVKHICLVLKHKWLVFKFACKAGIPWRGFLHDFSKFSPVELFESVRYYNGKKSPIVVSREVNGYSKAWLHHKGRNKHHFEYWVDISKTEQIGVFLPYKYMVEAICDKLAAGQAYKGKEWTKEEPYNYWINKERKAPVEKHPGTTEFVDTVLKKIYDDGIDAAINKAYLKSTYNKIQSKYFGINKQ